MTPRRALFVFGAVLVGINVLSALWDIRNDRSVVERNALRDFNNLTALLADQIARSLESVDVLLRAAATDISAGRAGDPGTRALRLKDRISGIPQIRGILLLDRDGRIVLSTDARSEIGADYSERSYFRHFREGAVNGRYVSEPFLGRITGRWIFAVSTSVTDGNGRFAGVLAALIDVDHFDSLYRSLDIGELGFVALMTRAGVLVTRVPPREDAYGKQLPDRGGVISAVNREGRFSGWASSMLDDPPAMILLSAAPIPDTPLVVSIGAPERMVLAPWQTESWRIIVRTMLTSAVMLALVALAARELAQRARADRSAQESREKAEVERESLQNKLRQAEKMEAVGRLAGGIAHDFNNILGGILGYGEMLLESAAEGSEEQRYARNLLIAANRARELVDQILTYSRSHRGARQPVEIGQIVQEALAVVRGSIPQAIALEFSLPGEPLVVIGDPTQIHQVVMNLCTNAVHAMGEQGTLGVSLAGATLEQELPLTQVILPPGRYVRLAVTDTGTGMDEATIAHIFEPFFTTKDVGQGTGLGLSLVYGIVADAGGATHVKSKPGCGSTFEIYLPRAEARAKMDDGNDGLIERGHGEHILLVDDEKLLLDVTVEMLTRLGYHPLPFSDPHAALAALEATPEAYDMLLTDEMMPGLTGTSLARSAQRLRPGLPVILISGYAGPMLTEMASGAGVREILKKPIQSRELAAALSRVLAA